MGSNGWRQLWLVAVIQLLAMACWFSASAVGAALSREWDLGPAALSWLTSAVQLGFVAGALGLAAFTVPDRVRPAVLISVAAALAGVATIATAMLPVGYGGALALRALTGAALAGVYPPGVRVATSWFQRKRGLAVGILVAALTVGSGSPHLLRAMFTLSWQPVLLAAGAIALVAAALATRLRLGPHARPAGALQPEAAAGVFLDPAQRRPVLGYLGHMWELYAFWTWLPTFVVLTGVTSGEQVVGLLSFGVIGVAGAIGCLVAGRLADRLGKAEVAAGALALSGVCCLLSPLVPWLPPAVGMAFLLLWGAAVIGDSALYSALVGDAAPPHHTGTALTVQIALGFALSVVTIRVLPALTPVVGWRYALVSLAIGPALGLLALRPLLGSGSRQPAATAPRT